MESIAHDFFCFMSKLLWPLFIYYLTVPQRSWCEEQFAVLSLLLFKDIFASWTWPFPVSVPGHLTHLPLHISKETLIFTIPHTSPLCHHFTYGLTTLISSIILSSFSKLCPALSTHKSSGVQRGDPGEPAQHGGTHLDLSQPWHRGHSIQMPLSHKGGTHKSAMFAESFSTEEPEKRISHSGLQGVH